MVEVIITLAIIVAAGVFAAINLFGQSNQTTLNSTASQVVALARQAQIDSAAQSKNAIWGIHFANTTNTTPYYAIFIGSSYASGTIQGYYPLPATVGYLSSTVPIGSSLDAIFSGVTGASSVSTTIGIYLITTPSLQQNISISGVGEVSYSQNTASVATISNITDAVGYNSSTQQYEGTFNVLHAGDNYLIIYGSFTASGNTVSINSQAVPGGNIIYQGTQQINLSLTGLSYGSSFALAVTNASGTGKPVTISNN